MELLCIEIDFERQAYEDPVFLDDERVLRNLLYTEDKYVLNSSYFNCVQNELKAHMRKIVASWMAEVCEEEQCQDEVFPLAVNIMDRFLALVEIRKNQLQLLGAVCLFLASKLRQTRPLCTKRLVEYTDYSITSKELLGWELVVLSRLKWDLAAITPNDFVSPILRRLPGWTKSKEILPHIKKHAQTFIALCAADYKFSQFPPSVVAAASVGTYIMGLKRGGGAKSAFDIRSKSLEPYQTDLIDVGFQAVHFLDAQGKASPDDDGALSIFNLNEWGKISDMFPLYGNNNSVKKEHHSSLDCIDTIAESVFCSEDAKVCTKLGPIASNPVKL
jgi:cyclin D2